MSKSALKRILSKDIKEISSRNLNESGIYIQFDEEDMLKAKAMIVGPKDSLYENGFLFFSITFPKNYPFAPPDVAYISRNNVRIHPNLYVGSHLRGHGKVCFSILGTWSGPKWTSIMDITTVILCIQSLLDGNPLHHEPGHEKDKSLTNTYYNQIIEYESIQTLLIQNILDIPQGYEIFYNDMRNEIIKNKDNIDRRIKQLLEKNPKPFKLNVPIYRINKVIDYSSINYQFDELMNKI